ncbi:hypothetical protein CCHL11_09158 [Colletotrichum chlorophyti]|uniref:DUF6546 domain-containing protein n=1 Tax=Colletotrichum chlorophyti TaxID=708187 RepID=A0A1Q8S8D1_9PEZI|nr:hypothetical protein CCHL11_09158 [Colletotrichum chlorophyti]
MAILRIFEPIGIVFNEDLPPLNAVTRFILRRQCRREIEPFVLGYLFDRFPRLKSLVHEPWQKWDRVAQELIYDEEHLKLLESHFPPTLKQISMFEETNEVYNELLRRRLPMIGPDAIRVASPAVGAALEKRSLNCEKLSVAFIVGAKDFLQSYQRHWVWKHMRVLIVTSRILTCTADLKEITSLLRIAATAALSMPSLHTMVL